MGTINELKKFVFTGQWRDDNEERQPMRIQIVIDAPDEDTARDFFLAVIDEESRLFLTFDIEEET